MIVKSHLRDALLVSEDEIIVQWEDKYATGIDLIDGQHRELVDLTNKLYAACLSRDGAAGPVFKEAMSRMVDYTRFHLKKEEELLERTNFPGFLDHKRQHEALVLKILEAVKNFNEGRSRYVPNNFVRVLKDWIFTHIAVMDKEYSAFIADQKRQGLLSDAEINGD